jgi:hypothetical protein
MPLEHAECFLNPTYKSCEWIWKSLAQLAGWIAPQRIENRNVSGNRIRKHRFGFLHNGETCVQRCLSRSSDDVNMPDDLGWGDDVNMPDWVMSRCHVITWNIYEFCNATMNNVTIGWYCTRIVWTSPSGVVIRVGVLKNRSPRNFHRWSGTCMLKPVNIRYDDCERIFHNIVSGCWKSLQTYFINVSERHESLLLVLQDCKIDRNSLFLV